MSAQTTLPAVVSDPQNGLVWFDIFLKAEDREGKITNFFLQFLALSDVAAMIRAQEYAEKNGMTMQSVRIRKSKEIDTPRAAPPAPAEPARRELSEDEKRVIAAFTLLPINYSATFYVKGTEVKT